MKSNEIAEGFYGVFVTSNRKDWEKSCLDQYGFKSNEEAKTYALPRMEITDEVVVYTYINRMGLLCMLPLMAGSREDFEKFKG